MTIPTPTALGPGGLASLSQILDAAGLPNTDLTEPHRAFFRFDANGLVGYAGLEGEGADRLLRSVVVLPDRRGLGSGTALIAALEQQASILDVRCLHLLTTTAAPFFRALGYVDADRTSAPASIAASCEFTSLCPASAAYLVKVL